MTLVLTTETNPGTAQWTDASAIGQKLVFVYAPGQPADRNVYNDFALLYADLAAAPALSPKVIVFVASSPGSIPIPAGNYNMTGVEWVGSVNLSTDGTFFFAVRLTITDGVVFTDAPPSLFQNLIIDFQNTAPVCTLPARFIDMVLVDSVLTKVFFTEPFVASSSLFQLSIFTRGYGGIEAPVFLVPNGATVWVQAEDKTLIKDSAFNIAVGGVVEIFGVGLKCTVQQQTIGQPATFVSYQYNPLNLADWSGIEPQTVENALDRIAAKITPIP